MLNVAEDFPTGTVTLAGTVTPFVVEDSLTAMPPPDPAAAFKVTVPTAFPPPAIVDGAIVSAVTWNGFTTSVVVCWIPPYEAVIVTDSLAFTNLCATVKVTLDEPAGILAVAGTAAELGSELTSLIVIGASTGPVNEIVPVTVV